MRRVWVLAAVTLACTSVAHAAAPPALVWPAPPEPARIAYESAFGSAADLGITPRLFSRLRDWMTGRRPDAMVKPMAVAVASDGVIYVADPGAHGVHRFDVAHRRYTLLGGPGGRALPSPVGLGAGPAGRMYIVDSRLARVFAVEPGAREAAPVALAGELRQPTGVAYDAATRSLAVVDARAHDIAVFAADGTLRARWGARGNAPGTFNFPTALARDGDGRLAVCDALNFRVQVLDGAGHMLAHMGQLGDGSGDFARPKGVACDAAGRVYVSDALFHAVQIFDPAGRYLLGFGQLGTRPGEFWMPAGLCVAPDGRLFVADPYNRRVQVFRIVEAGR